MSFGEARATLGVESEEIVRTWIANRWLRSRVLETGQVQVLRSDVLAEKRVREELAAVAGAPMTPDELRELREARPGALPWQRNAANASE